MISWFFIPYTPRPVAGRPTRRGCLVDDFAAQITLDGGAWSIAECLGDYAVVKVSASATTLTAINAVPGIIRIPLSALDNTLDTLTLTQRQQLRTFLGNLGYSGAEITSRFSAGSDLAGFTVGDVLRFALLRRKQPRYDELTDTIILDGPDQPTRPVEDVDRAVV